MFSKPVSNFQKLAWPGNDPPIQDRLGAWLAGNSTIINPTAVAVDNKKPFLQETSPGARWLACLSKLHLQG